MTFSTDKMESGFAQPKAAKKENSSIGGRRKLNTKSGQTPSILRKVSQNSRGLFGGGVGP
jgi:hypothetical protein